jgi:hypothetical protein
VENKLHRERIWHRQGALSMSFGESDQMAP